MSVARLLHPVRPGTDVGWQIVAAQNLLAGGGLTIPEHSGPVLNDPPALITLAHFPAGYSLGIASLLAVGFDEPSAMKALGLIATIFGWLGWGLLAERYVADGLRTHRWLRPIALGMALLTPLLFTLPWPGTDIFLWAIVPWVTLCVAAGDRETEGWSDCFAGVLSGVAILMRYASVFLLMFAGVLILLQAWNRPKIVLRRLVLIGIGAMPCLCLQLWINSSAPAAAPGGVAIARAAAAPWERVLFSLSLLPTANEMWTFWLPGKFALLLLDVMASWRWTLGFAIVISGAVVVLLRRHSVRDIRAGALVLFLALPVVLLAAMQFGPYGYVGDRRYYGPVMPLAVLVAWWIAASRKTGSTMSGGVRAAAGAYATAYVIAIVGYTLLMFTPTTLGATQRTKLLGDELIRWPSLAEGHSLLPSRQLVGRMLRERPGAFLLTSRIMVFLWDPSVDRTKLVGLACSSSRPSRLRGPADIILVTFDRGDSTDLWSYSGSESKGSISAADCFENLPELSLVQRFPEEGMKVLRARIPAGADYIIRP